MEKFTAEMAKKATKTKDQLLIEAIEKEIKKAIKKGGQRLRFPKKIIFGTSWDILKVEFESRGFNCVETKTEYQINWI
jgi:hypothetical protein